MFIGPQIHRYIHMYTQTKTNLLFIKQVDRQLETQAITQHKPVMVTKIRHQKLDMAPMVRTMGLSYPKLAMDQTHHKPVMAHKRQELVIDHRRKKTVININGHNQKTAMNQIPVTIQIRQNRFMAPTIPQTVMNRHTRIRSQ